MDEHRAVGMAYDARRIGPEGIIGEVALGGGQDDEVGPGQAVFRLGKNMPHALLGQFGRLGMLCEQDAEEERAKIPLQAHEFKKSRPSKREHEPIENQETVLHLFLTLYPNPVSLPDQVSV